MLSVPLMTKHDLQVIPKRHFLDDQRPSQSEKEEVSWPLVLTLQLDIQAPAILKDKTNAQIWACGYLKGPWRLSFYSQMPLNQRILLNAWNFAIRDPCLPALFPGGAGPLPGLQALFTKRLLCVQCLAHVAPCGLYRWRCCC